MKRILRVNRDAMNAMLPPIPPDFEQSMRDMIFAMPAERKDMPMKRKISFGLILALVLTLLAVSALAAAFLGGKDFVDQIVAPKAAESADHKFTQAEVREILRIARENNLELDEDTEQRLLRLPEGYYKDELMRLFVKAEYGSQPAAWPIEVQRWYEEMLHACGLSQGHIVNVLPEAGEITQEEALQIALEYIRAHYDPDLQVADESLYTRYLSFRETVENPFLTTRRWQLYYYARDLYHPDYRLEIDNHGRVTDAEAYPSALSDPAAFDSVGSRIQRKYENEYGVVNYTTDIMLEYQDLLRQYVAQAGDERLSRAEKHLLNQEFVRPDDTLISAYEAIRRAKAACGDRNWANLYRDGETALCMLAEGRPVWRVTLRAFDTPDESHWSNLYLQLDAKTGDVLYLDDTPTPAVNGGLWRGWVTEEYWRENKPIPLPGPQLSAAAPTPRPDGKPVLWGNTDVAPAWFWARLDEENVTNDTASAWLTRIEDTYGLDSRWWPLEAQAISEIRWELIDEARYAALLPIHGLPTDGDLPREQAEDIARTAFDDAFGDTLGRPADTWLLAAHFFFRSPDTAHNSWAFDVVDPDTFELAGFVSLDAKTGEINGLDLSEMDMLPIVADVPRATPAPRPDGTPWMWEADFAPAAFWQQLKQTMDANGVTFDNIEDKVQKWTEAYGGEEAYNLFWPQELKVMQSILCDISDPEDPMFQYAAFPKPGGISQQQAVDLAWDAFLPLCRGAEGEAARIVTADWIGELRPSATLWHSAGPSYRLPSGEYWIVQFMRWEGGAYETRGYVALTQEGDVLFAELELIGNG